MVRMSGESNVPGAPKSRHDGMPLGLNSSLFPGTGAQLAGSPGYFMSEKEIGDRIFRQGMQTTPLGGGEETQRRIQDFRNKYPGVFGAQAGMSPVGNAGFYAGPQLGQFGQNIPAGFQNK